MALAPGASSAGDYGQASDAPQVDAPGLNYFVFALFFIFGGITSLNDVIIPKLKELFTLNFFEASLVQFWFFIAYAIVGIPGARLVKKLGYMRGAVAGLVAITPASGYVTIGGALVIGLQRDSPLAPNLTRALLTLAEEGVLADPVRYGFKGRLQKPFDLATMKSELWRVLRGLPASR